MSSISLTIPWRHCVPEMATGSGRPVVDMLGVDFQVQIQTLWNALEAYVTLDSDRIYELQMSCVSDVLGLRERQLLK